MSGQGTIDCPSHTDNEDTANRKSPKAHILINFLHASLSCHDSGPFCNLLPLCLKCSLLVLFSKPENMDSLVFTWPGSKHQETWMFRLASFTDRIEELQTRKVSPLAWDVLVVERKGENHVYRDTPGNDDHDQLSLDWKKGGDLGHFPPLLKMWEIGGRVCHVHDQGSIVGGLCCGCLEHFVPEVSPKSQTMPAVPGNAEPGLLRFVF